MSVKNEPTGKHTNEILVSMSSQAHLREIRHRAVGILPVVMVGGPANPKKTNPRHNGRA